MSRPSISIQLCTYNRAALLRRVLRGCFEQTVSDYEVVLVNDGSTDDTEAVIEEARALTAIRFRTVTHTNRGLARSRNIGIELASAPRIIFIDDDVLPMPNFVEEHLRTAERHAQEIVRGAVIMTESFERLPPPIWSLKDYSANFFWTSNVSVPVETLRRVGAFNENFHEYGWEDIELGLRLRAAGVGGRFNRYAVAFHYKPPITAGQVPGMLAQARAQARTAVELARIHRSWRVTLATGDDPVQRSIDRLMRKFPAQKILLQRFAQLDVEHVLTPEEQRLAYVLRRHAYYAELDAAHART